MAGTPDASHAPRYYAALDGLRGYAAGLVLLLHLMGAILTEYFRVPESRISATSEVLGIAVMAFLAEGHHGVEIFFVLSGFLMARLASNRRGWADFYARRIRRIYPAFVASLACSAALYCLAYAWEFSVKDFLLNLVFANAWPGSGVIAYNHVSWTLAYEFAFYLTLPLLFALPGRTWRCAAAVLVVIGVVLLAPPPFMRMASLYAGFALGCLPDSSIGRHVRRVPVQVVLAIYAAFVCAKALGWINALVFFSALPVLICMLVSRVAFDEGRVGRFFASGPMTWLGRRSYSLYLWHSPVIAVVVYELLPASGLGAMPELATAFIVVACVLITLGVSMVSYRWIEVPFLVKRPGPSARPPATPVAPRPDCDSRAVAVKLAPPL